LFLEISSFSANNEGVFILILVVIAILAVVGLLYGMILSSRQEDVRGWVAESVSNWRSENLGVEDFEVQMNDAALGELFPTLTIVGERLELARASLAHLSGVEVDVVPGLLADYCRERGAGAIVKGLRGGTDLDAEVPMALLNRDLGAPETVFLPASPAYAHISSSLVKDIAGYGRDVSALVPPAVARRWPAMLLGETPAAAEARPSETTGRGRASMRRGGPFWGRRSGGRGRGETFGELEGRRIFGRSSARGASIFTLNNHNQTGPGAGITRII